jgi:hypothetical protein
MSGIVCQILHNATIVDPSSDAQWRSLFTQGDIAQTVANMSWSNADKLCKILAQTTFSYEDKKWFATLMASIWGQGYS